MSDETNGWDQARSDRLTASLLATPVQRLAWLEEMIVLAYQSGALPRQEARVDDAVESDLTESKD